MDTTSNDPANDLGDLRVLRQKVEEQNQKLTEQSRELKELRQAFADLRSNGMNTGAFNADKPGALTDRRGALKKVAGLAAGVATAGLLRPTRSAAENKLTAPAPTNTGDNMTIGQSNFATAPGDVTRLVNLSTALFPVVWSAENYGNTAFPVPASSYIGSVAYVNDAGSSTSGGTLYGLFARASTDGSNTAIGAFCRGHDFGIQGVGTGSGSIGVQGEGTGIGSGVQGFNDDNNVFAIGVDGSSAHGTGGEFQGARAAIRLAVDNSAVSNPNNISISGLTGDLYPSLNASFGVGYSGLWFRTALPTNPYRRLVDGTTAGALTVNSPPQRIIDTRNGSGFFDAGNHYVNDTLRNYNIAALASLPTGTQAVVGRITVVGATASGVIQESPNGPPGAGNDLGPGTAVVNYPSAAVISSFGATFVSALDSNGHIRVRGFMAGGGTVDVIIDITGYYL